MLHALPAYRAHCERTVSVSDITLVVPVRAHQGNPWVAERVRMIAESYDPMPEVVILDFGSVSPHRDQLAAIAERCGFRHRHVDDDDLYSAARAHNLGFAEVRTPLVFFMDVDCTGTEDLFTRLADAANAIELGGRPDQMLNLPVYHLSRDSTVRIVTEADRSRRSRALRRIAADAAFEDFRGAIDFIAPYSNIFLCHSSYFDMVGGYDETFRGHGSEDFELLFRFAYVAGGLPLPVHPLADVYGPLKKDFFGAKTYRGFRRLLELLALPAELEGLRIFHLDHPKADRSGWYERNDWKRDRFNAVVGDYLTDPKRLLERDFLPRSRRALVLAAGKEDVTRFLPLRLAGYRLVSDEQGGETAGFDLVAASETALASSEGTRETFDGAVRAGARGLVLEHGLLPDSIRYRQAGTVPHAALVTPAEHDVARAYREALLRGGGDASSEEPASTHARLVAAGARAGRSCLLVLGPGTPPAPVAGLASLHPSVRFLALPASDSSDLPGAPNLSWLPSTANVHALIEGSDIVVDHAGRAALLALLTGRRAIVYGDGAKTVSALVKHAATLDEAIGMAARSDEAPPPDGELDDLAASLLFHDYSFASQGRVYRCLFDGLDLRVRLTSLERPLGLRSYAAARLGVGIAPPKPRPPAPKAKHTKLPVPKKLKKLIERPDAFFADSGSEVLQSFGDRFFPRDDPEE